MRSRPLALALVIIILAAPLTAAQEYPTLEFYVNDHAGVLTLQDELDIEELCIIVYQETGAEIAVLVVNTTQPDEINLYATRTFNQNGLGQEGKDDGLLVLISVDERLWRVEVGYGLESVLPDSLVGSIAEDYLIPGLQSGDYYAGIYDLVNHLGYEILENYDGEPHDDPYPVPGVPLRLWHYLIIIILVVAIAVLCRGRIWWFFFLRGGSGGGSGGWGSGRTGGGWSGGKTWGGGRSGGGGAGGKW
jgi:uncharacterized protein